ncbi:hypothetical protein AB5N19_07801 [Seiridium cardinale]
MPHLEESNPRQSARAPIVRGDEANDADSIHITNDVSTPGSQESDDLNDRHYARDVQDLPAAGCPGLDEPQRCQMYPLWDGSIGSFIISRTAFGGWKFGYEFGCRWI